MTKVFKAQIKWLTKELGGRQTVPWGDKYGPIIVIKGHSLNLHDENWSLLVNNKETCNVDETLAEVRYLVEGAPDNLCKDVEFELYEGTKLVANGIIL